MSDWEPYFRPTRKVHDSGFRCFECGYLVLGDDYKAAKKVVIASGVDHISNWFMNCDKPTAIDMDLLLDGNIRVFRHGHDLFWDIPGWSDACITITKPFDFGDLDRLWKEQNEEKKDGTSSH